jgi:hypothetical protein
MDRILANKSQYQILKLKSCQDDITHGLMLPNIFEICL